MGKSLLSCFFDSRCSLLVFLRLCCYWCYIVAVGLMLARVEGVSWWVFAETCRCDRCSCLPSLRDCVAVNTEHTVPSSRLQRCSQTASNCNSTSMNSAWNTNRVCTSLMPSSSLTHCHSHTWTDRHVQGGTAKAGFWAAVSPKIAYGSLRCKPFTWLLCALSSVCMYVVVVTYFNMLWYFPLIIDDIISNLLISAENDKQLTDWWLKNSKKSVQNLWKLQCWVLTGL